MPTKLVFIWQIVKLRVSMCFGGQLMYPTALPEDHLTERLKTWGKFEPGRQIHAKSLFQGFTFNQNMSELVYLFSNLVLNVNVRAANSLSHFQLDLIINRACYPIQ